MPTVGPSPTSGCDYCLTATRIIKMECQTIAKAMAKINQLEKEIAAKDEEIAKLHQICGMSTPWPIQSILHKLAECADILLDEKDYDGHGWELIHEARLQARTRIAALQENEG